MPTPEGWKGSNLRSRTEVVAWLKRQGGRYEQSDGLMVGRMRTELGMGRALSQLLADMEHDGMIRREVRGRRTLSIELVDDWGLTLNNLPSYPRLPANIEQREATTSTPDVTTGVEMSAGEVDYEQLAAVLLAKVVSNAQAIPSQGAEVGRLQVKVDDLTASLSEARAQLATWMAEAQEQRQQAETMRVNLIRATAELERLLERPAASKAMANMDQKSRDALKKIARTLVP